MIALTYTCIALFILVSLILSLLILIQKGRGGGLSSAFGGSGGNTAFGAKTGDVLTWATSVIFGVFLFLAVVLNLLTNPNAPTNAPTNAPAPTNLPTQPPIIPGQ